MGLFSTIMSKIFGHAEAATPTSGTADAQASAGAPAAAAPATPAAPVDVDAVLSDLASKAGQPLNYKTSIVDLLKLLGLDSSLEARKQLAGELHYTGSTDDSATMNVWLIKQVYAELAKNGGKVPEGWAH
ncbi:MULTISPECIES: DUF3597 domain-containing protein [Gluconobacter]|jgi:hypothetical protein|uniref:DUF3597 domain-containing protein n=3 Tax=Gluconobacter TaxID=441 RepID=A0A9Q2FK17_GLUJA|nr:MULTISPECIES: DUF3597 domain-containing protein [Gluconobacter]GAN89607.1 hypothetical protein Gbfr_007_064 [Gluconobacter frateurii M-2]GAP23200.1 hypothetical protein GLF_0082 [Gluconobacter frateurii NBRC 101659]KXV26454.1 hypothetical protein AD937_06760 [Gluconobacter japonicus]KXV29949.1 hypothetical protein AD936_17730 [Gluconobacter japonicus]KXV40048.1 hypothetical protein AD942_07165 [Gluconobacter japonicus]